jgi:hypothetical protein
LSSDALVVVTAIDDWNAQRVASSERVTRRVKYWSAVENDRMI